MRLYEKKLEDVEEGEENRVAGGKEDKEGEETRRGQREMPKNDEDNQPHERMLGRLQSYPERVLTWW